jgi:hypothetical protein
MSRLRFGLCRPRPRFTPAIRCFTIGIRTFFQPTFLLAELSFVAVSKQELICSGKFKRMLPAESGSKRK